MILSVGVSPTEIKIKQLGWWRYQPLENNKNYCHSEERRICKLWETSSTKAAIE